MYECVWFACLIRMCLWFAVLANSTVAVPRKFRSITLQEWKSECNCSCSTEVINCTMNEAYFLRRGNLWRNPPYQPQFPPKSPWLLSCELNLKRIRDKYKYVLFNLSCKGQLGYVIYKKSRLTNLQLLSTSRPSKQDERESNNYNDPPNGLVIGLSVGFGLMVTIIVCWIWIRCRRRKAKRKSDRKNQHPEHGYIDEEEDSVPYRIVDLQTNMSTDASGYTFLEAKKNDEEQPYMKLKPKCSRIHNEGECSGDKTHSIEEVVNDEDEERPYETLQPTHTKVHEKEDMEDTENQNHPFEEIADEPVYFMLEGKGKSLKT